MELKGHSAAVLSLSFNGDSQRLFYEHCSMGIIYVQRDNNDELNLFHFFVMCSLH